MLLAFSKSNDSPCFVKIAIFRHKRTVILIELPFFSFCAMMDARTRTRACLRYWMTIGNHADKSVFAEKAKGKTQMEYRIIS